MTLASEAGAGLRHAGRFFIGGRWVAPASTARIEVIDSATEEVFLSVAEAQAQDIAAAVTAAREAFDPVNPPGWRGVFMPGVRL